MRATLLIWLWEMACNLIDFITEDVIRERSWVKKDRTAPLRSADASRPECAERPHLPPQIIIHLAIGDREHGRAIHNKDFEERRFLWAAGMEAEEMIREVEEGI